MPLPRIQLILNFHTDHLWPLLRAKRACFRSLGERAKRARYAGARGRCPGAEPLGGGQGAQPPEIKKKSKQFRPPESNSSTQIQPDLLNN